MGKQMRLNMTNKTIIKKEEAQEYTDLVTALFWIASGELITKNVGEYELNSATDLILWWSAVGLLGVDHAELNKYSKYFIRDNENMTPQQFQETQEAMIAVRRLNSEIFKQSIEKLTVHLKTLLDKKLSLYGTKYKDNKLVEYFAKIPRVKLSNIDIQNETLFYDGYEYIKLRVSTEELFEKFPSQKTQFSTKSLNNNTGTMVLNTDDLLKRKLGGRKPVFTEQPNNLLKGFIMNNGGLDWYKIKYDVRILDCRDFLKKNNVNASKRTISDQLKKIKKELQTSEN